MFSKIVLSVVALSCIILGLKAQFTTYSSLGPSASNFVTDTRYVSGGLPITETTSGFTSMNQLGHSLGYNANQQSFTFADSLSGYAYGNNVNNFNCENLNPVQCRSNADYCELVTDTATQTKNCRRKTVIDGLFPSIPNAPNFHAKLHFHAKGTVRSVFVDIDTRTRLGQMDQFTDRAINYFFHRFGLNFEYFNTYEGAQMIPFKWTDEMYLQVQDAYLPTNSITIPERNRVLVDGFLVKPLYGETVVLKGEYAQNVNQDSVFLEPDEILIYLEYRVVDEFNRLFHKFRFDLCEPLKTNRVGIAGWTASITRVDHELENRGDCLDYYRNYDPTSNRRNSCFDWTWGIGVDQGILEIVEYDGLMDFAFSNVITFPGPHFETRPPSIIDPETKCHEALFYGPCSTCGTTSR